MNVRSWIAWKQIGLHQDFPLGRRLKHRALNKDLALFRKKDLPNDEAALWSKALQYIGKIRNSYFLTPRRIFNVKRYINMEEEGPETVHILSWWPQNKHGVKTARWKLEWLKERFLSAHILVNFCYLVSNFLLWTMADTQLSHSSLFCLFQNRLLRNIFF